MGNHVYNTYSNSRHENPGCSPSLHSLVACFWAPPFAINCHRGSFATSKPTDPGANLRPAVFFGKGDNAIRSKDNIPLKAFSLQIAPKGSPIFWHILRRNGASCREISSDVTIAAYHVLACRAGGLYMYFYFLAGRANLKSRVHSAKRTRFKTYRRRWYLPLCTFIHWSLYSIT